MAEDEVKKTGGQVDGKRLQLASVPLQVGADATGLFRIPSKEEISKLILMQTGDLVIFTILYLNEQVFF